jgi:predicted metalloprotease with PDZ domain
LPQPTQVDQWQSNPKDIDYPGTLTLAIDATDKVRGILKGRMTIPVAKPGPMTLLYPKWMPGYHSPQNPIELFAGLEIKAGDAVLHWQRDPVEVYAFHLEVPEGTDALDVQFQFLSQTCDSQGDVVVIADMMNLQWGRMLVYPSGYFVRRIQIEASLKLPEGWQHATVLQARKPGGPEIVFEPVPLDVLVDSPVMAGRHSREVPLDDGDTVGMAMFAHRTEHLEVTGEQISLKRALVDQAEKLFSARHFDRYRFTVALSDELGGGGVEHHRSAEIVCPPTYFTEWEKHFTKRDVFAHEFVHSWNGKFRRGADSWTPSFEVPIRNSLMWLYEGQTQYWGHILTARAGLWTTQTALEALAKVIATYDVRPGGEWRTMADTTRDPVINARAPLPWPSWQRNEDYYSEGQLLWFAADTLIRELTGDRKSLDDFAQAFFGCEDGRMITLTYDFNEVIATLRAVVDHDWTDFINRELHSRGNGAPVEWLERGGYKLVYRPYRTDFCKSFDSEANQFDLRFSIGLTMGSEGTVQEVLWGSAAFDAGLVSGALVQKVNGQPYQDEVIGQAVEDAANGAPLVLTVRARPESQPFDLEVAYTDGHRFPHLEPIEGARLRLDEIYAARES